MYQYFTFKGINSLDMGVVMLKAPSIYKPTKRVNEIQIAGRNGSLHEDTNTYENYTKEAECHVRIKAKLTRFVSGLQDMGK